MRTLFVIMSCLIMLFVWGCSSSYDANRSDKTTSSYNGDNTNTYYSDIGQYYHLSPQDVTTIHDRRVPNDELPVVFFIAQRAHVEPSTVADLRMRGTSWMDISNQYGLTPEVFYVPVSGEVTGGPYEQVYTYYKDKPRTEWNTIRLSDDDVINVVNLRFLSEYSGLDTPTIMKMRSEGKDFIEINQSAKMKKEGRQ